MSQTQTLLAALGALSGRIDHVHLPVRWDRTRHKKLWLCAETFLASFLGCRPTSECEALPFYGTTRTFEHGNSNNNSSWDSVELYQPDQQLPLGALPVHIRIAVDDPVSLLKELEVWGNQVLVKTLSLRKKKESIIKTNIKNGRYFVELPSVFPSAIFEFTDYSN